MRIHSLTLDNVRGIEHLELRELPDTGVIVIHGDNEQGKSTIMDALNVVLNQKHSAGNRHTKPLKPVHRDASPSVSLTATLGPVTFTIEKTWFRGKSARLTITAPQRESYTGDQAEAKLEELKERHLDAALLTTLFLRQDELGASVDAVGIPTLTRALDGAAGTDGESGTEDSGLLAAVDAEYRRYYTATGRDTGEFAQAKAELDAASTELAEATSLAAELDTFVTRFDRVTADRQRAEADLPEALTEAEELAGRARAAAEAAEKAARLHEDLARADEAVTHARGAVDQRRQLVDAVSLATADLTRRREGLDDATAAAEQEKTQLTSLGDQLAAARERQHSATEGLRAARATQRQAQDITRRDALAGQLAEVGELNEQIRTVRETQAGRQITDADVRAVEQATAEVTLQRRLREQAAAKLQLTATASTMITVNGEPVSVDGESTAVELADGTEITIGDVTARYVAGYAESTRGTDPVADAEKSLADLLADLDCADIDAVRAARDLARDADEKLATLTRQRSTLLGGSDPEALAAEHDRLVAELATADAVDLDPTAAAAAVRAAEEEQDTASAEASRIDAALTPWRDRTAALALTELNTRIEAAEATLATAEKSLAAAEEKVGAAELAAGVEKAQAARDAVAERVTLADAEVAEANPELARNLHDGAVARVESLRAAMTRAENQLAELTGRIDMATGAAERLEKAEAAHEAARHRCDSVTRRAEAARLLRETLHRHRDAARARYAQPFADQLSRLARTVFGHDVEFGLSEDLQVTRRSIGDATVPLEDLSGGAKEQLAILTRFAIAGLVSQDTGDGRVPVPVVVDDALGSTDPSRLQLMATLFTEMGKTSQVIVLTCVPQRYDRVVGRTEYPIDELKSAGRLI